MFCRLRQCRQILPKLNLSAILLLFLIKRAALGNLKVNFHCAHLHRFFPLKKALSKTHQSSLTLKGGSTSHLGLLPSGEKREPLLLVALNHFILWMADHQRSTPAAELRFFVRDEPQGHTMQDACSMLMEPHGYDEECSMLIARNLLRLLLMGTQGHE